MEIEKVKEITRDLLPFHLFKPSAVKELTELVGLVCIDIYIYRYIYREMYRYRYTDTDTCRDTCMDFRLGLLKYGELVYCESLIYKEYVNIQVSDEDLHRIVFVALTLTQHSYRMIVRRREVLAALEFEGWSI